jgi:hypothetical protein
MQLNADVISRFSPRVRIIIGMVILAFTTLGLLGAIWLLRDKFADVATVLSDPGRLFKPPEEYTLDERRLLSSRAYLWANYIDGYLGGGIKNLVLGFGPNAWEDKFPVYAHNTLVSTLYEYGIVGVVGMLALWGTMFTAALLVKKGPKGKLLAAHASFLILNMATMPHWTIEGNLLYAIICGYTFYLLLGPATRPVPKAEAAPAAAFAAARQNILK